MASRSGSSLTVQDKLALIQELSFGVPTKEVAEKYGLHPSSVRRIKRQAPELQEFADGNPTATKRMRKPVLEDLDRRVHSWLMERRALGNRISGPLLKEAAIRLNTEIGGPESFQASNGWLHKFKTRHGMLRSCADIEDDQSVEDEKEGEGDEEEIEEDIPNTQGEIGTEKLRNIFKKLESWASTLPVEAQHLVTGLKRFLPKELN